MNEKKPLELKVYPLREKVGRLAQPGYIVGKRGIIGYMLQHQMRAKRLTEPELAAEYHQALGEANLLMMAPRRAGKMMAANRVNTLLRFASTPHYFEAAA